MNLLSLNLKVFLNFITYDGLFESVSLVSQPDIAVAILQADPNHELTYLEHVEESSTYILWLVDAWITEKKRRELVHSKHEIILKPENKIEQPKTIRRKPASVVTKNDAMLTALESGNIELAIKLGEQIRLEKQIDEGLI